MQTPGTRLPQRHLVKLPLPQGIVLGNLRTDLHGDHDGDGDDDDDDGDDGG